MKTTKTTAATGRTVKNVGVWLTEYADPNGLKNSSTDSHFMRSISVSSHDMKSAGWTKVGTATISVELIPEKQMVTNKVDALNAQLQKERADSEVKCNRILEQISKLQALEYTA